MHFKFPKTGFENHVIRGFFMQTLYSKNLQV